MRAASSNARFDLAKHSAGHPKQLAFSASKSKYVAACCSRRAGKTEGCSGILISSAQERPGSVSLYITKTRVNAKRIMWRPLKRALVGIDCSINEAELCVTLPNGSAIYLAGADQRDEIEKHRGNGFGVVVVDEAQLLPAYLEQLVDDVLAPALMDYDGSLVLVGTPAPVPVGYFWECMKPTSTWDRHEWTVFDNPWILKKSGKTPAQHLAAECARRGVTSDDPSIQREFFGRWAHDPSALVFRYDAAKNDFSDLPDATRGDWESVVGVDLGFDDADAVAVLRWHTTLPGLWLVEESVLPKQTITQLGERLRATLAKYSPISTVVDTGALGKKISAELTERWGLNVTAAEKERKLEHIELLNDAMRSGNFFAKKDSRFAQDCLLVEWDRKNPEKPKIGDRYHSDIADAVLYAFRQAKNHFSMPAPGPRPRPGTLAWTEAAAARREAEDAANWDREAAELDERRREREEEEEAWRHT